MCHLAHFHLFLILVYLMVNVLSLKCENWLYILLNRRLPFQYHNLNTILLTKLILRMVKTDSIIRKFFIEGVYCYYDNI